MPETTAIPRTAKQSRQWLVGLVLLALLLVLIWWFWPAKPQSQAGSRWGDGGAVPVRVATVTQGSFPIELKALGTVTAYNTVNVRGRVDGELVKLLFEDGQRVKAGDLLAVIDPRPYEVALQQALGVQQENQAQLRNAELDLARYRGLYAEDSIAKQTLDTQQALVSQYRGTLKSNQAAVAEARLNLDFTQVRAPISGRLGLRQVDRGNLVKSGDTLPLVVITQTLPISLMFTLPEAELPAVLRQFRAGQRLHVEAWDRSDKLKMAEGYLDSLDNLIDTATGTVKLKARFENAEELLFPNQFVNVRLLVETREQALLIPAAALQFGARGTFVYVIDEQDKVQIRPIVAGPSNGQMTLIEQGVAVGERLVLEGTDRLRDGSAVEVVGEGQAPTAKQTSVRTPADA
ncbi:MdtA/MuxA family multidrug efflux RND transporter periplasmic adaptor subunit [Pseudomonas sp. MMS21-TM103]|uniref:MdtA/MuxA family multidrug efflux RND transporter periplasmic adaptor subunit n=1 Tax=Pseudomonas sp. MMS21 TM103 TaxID=2886506 RepID=UPI001EDDFE1D|nr:MdtA/MuxA family multidrug efflux RND transporter periplasmic adaptor subunit [Pseudomonas sp. MMS21 TM103]MCG4453110.1 MdtA/MuxA family multidrug efflux RND transporter periplasmic adaptor subunit [Pseudomonas sp. MMS21 TM103]